MKGIWKRIYIAKSFCHTPETDIIVNQLYFNNKKKTTEVKGDSVYLYIC